MEETKAYNLPSKGKYQKVIELLDESPKLVVHQSPAKWTINEEKVKEAENELELEAIRYSSKYAQLLKDEKVPACKIANISIGANTYTPMVRDSIKAMHSSLPEPSKEDVAIKVNAKYLYSCKEGMISHFDGIMH